MLMTSPMLGTRDPLGIARRRDDLIIRQRKRPVPSEEEVAPPEEEAAPPEEEVAPPEEEEVPSEKDVVVAPINWGFIGGIIAAILVLSVAILFLVRRRRASA